MLVAAAAARAAASAGFIMLQHDMRLVAAGDLVRKCSLPMPSRLELELLLLVVTSLVDSLSAFEHSRSISGSMSPSISIRMCSRRSERISWVSTGEGGSTITLTWGNLHCESNGGIYDVSG